MFVNRPSLFITLGITIILSVSSFIFLQSYFHYQNMKSRLIKELNQDIQYSASLLKHNMFDFIASYEPNEYEQLVGNQMNSQNLLAIVVEDYLMGEVIGEPAYITGKIRDDQWDIIDFDPGDAIQQQLLAGYYNKKSFDLFDANNKKMASVSLYLTDKFVQKELNTLVKNNVVNAIFITIVLLLAIYLSIYYSALKPISGIVDNIHQANEDGIPGHPFTTDGAEEIHALSSAMNRMLEAIKNSKIELQEQHNFLQSVLNSIDDPVMVINLDQSINMMNKAAAQELPVIHEAEPVDQKCYEMLQCQGKDNLPHHACPFKREKTTSESTKFILKRMQNNRVQSLEISATPLLNSREEVIGVIEVGRDITQHLETLEKLKEQEVQTRYQANHDALTGLANRYLFFDRVKQALKKARRNNTMLAVLFIDLDHFKQVNDSLGHEIGDQLLLNVTKKLINMIREEDTLARLGGDEFVIMIEGLSEQHNASSLATSIINKLSQPIIIDHRKLYVGCSIGISLYPENGNNEKDLLKHADVAMYKAKEEGRNNYQYYTTEMTEKAIERLALESALHNALNHDEFIVYYQPQINARTGCLAGLEALVRWRNPDMGLVSPARFIPVAEAIGQMTRIDRIVLKTSMRQLASWYRSGLKPGILAVNLTLQHLHVQDFIPVLESLIKETGCKAEWLELEVTEGQLMTQPEKTIAILKQINALGIKLALDDFGTGYSSLAYLKKLPINKLKIDRSFIMGLPDDIDDVALNNTVIALGQHMNLEIIAEGVETNAQKEFLIQNGCELIQGYYYSKPLSAKDMEEWISSFQSEHNFQKNNA